MKISKLFHWLYALIMFLPVFFWIPTAFYYGFNEHATAPETEKEIFERVQIDFNQYIQNEYINLENYETGSPYGRFCNAEWFGAFHKVYIHIELSGILEKIHINYDNGTSNYNSYDNATTYADLDVILNMGNYPQTRLVFYALPYQSGQTINVSNFNVYDLTQMFGEGNEPTIEEFKQLFTQDSYSYNTGTLMYIDIPTGEYKTYIDITSNMSQSWQDVWQQPLFSWTHDTFFSAPFNYIAGLFGIASNNTLSYALSYWFSISIIWLVFDLMIYVPLLVHRWLDKAAIE